MFSCKSENNSNKKKDIDIYYNNEKFESVESEKLNSEGVELAKKNELNKAETKLLKALKIEPNNPTVLNNIGNVKKLKKEYDESIKYYEKSLTVSDSLYLNSALNIGIVSYQNEKYIKSEKILKYVIIESNDLKLTGIAYYNLVLVYLKQNKCGKAKMEFKKSEQIFKKNFQFAEQYEYLKSEIKNCVQHRV